MSTPDITPSAAPEASATPAAVPDAGASAVNAPLSPPEDARHRVLVWGLVATALLGAGSLGLAWATHERVQMLEAELVRRQQTSQDDAAQARMLARQAHDAATQTEAKLALLDAKLAETALQRSQVEDLISSLSRSRDENVLADVESGLRVAQQQAAITGSAEPLMTALRQADDRLARYNQPRLERVRRAVARDMDRLRAVAVADVPSLSIRLDEVVRQVDDLPLVTTPARQAVAVPPARTSARSAAKAAAKTASAASGAEAVDGLLPEVAWWSAAKEGWQRFAAQASGEVRSLVRVTQVNHPEAALLTPEQSVFLRENLKLHLLNARLALLSRQFDQAQSDIGQAQQLLARYFDTNSRRVRAVVDQLQQVAGQSRQSTLPRPDDTLAALATAASGR